MHADPEVRQLRAFVAVVEAGGVTRAAGVLGLSQSTVSEAIAALERTLGAAVLVRGRRGPALTPAGERLLPGARRVLAALDAAVAAVAEGEATARATVSLGTSESVSAYLLPDVLAALRREWPGTRWVVTTAPCEAIRRELREGRLDVGIVLTAADPEPDEEWRSLAAGRLVLLAHPAHPLAGHRAAARAVADATLVLSDAAGDFWGRVRGYVESAGGTADRLQSAGSVEGVKRAVAADAAVLGVLPAYAAADELARGVFREVVASPALPPVWVRAIWRAQGTLPPRATALVERVGAAAARVARLDASSPSAVRRGR